jgi:hypothetical protein
MTRSLLSQYFKDLNNLLSASVKLGGVTKESTELGKNREILVVTTLKRHLPSRVQVIQGGIIVDSRNNFTHQIDVAICNSFSFMGNALEYGIIPVEAITAAIEVKSTVSDETLRQVFTQLDNVKKLKKEIADSVYDGSDNLPYRTKRALTIGWFWKGSKTIKNACEWLCNPENHIKELGYEGNRPNAIYLHDRYLLICDPKPSSGLPKEEAGLPNPFLLKFRDKKGVLRKNKQFEGRQGALRDIYHFEAPNFEPIQVLFMWLTHEVNRYALELPDVASYISYEGK